MYLQQISDDCIKSRQQGVAEQEAAQMVVTEPGVNCRKCGENITSYPITPEVVSWNQSMLTVKEAYFDGSSLSFVGNLPMRQIHMITCDHATMNGKDALASLNKIEGERSLLCGHITFV